MSIFKKRELSHTDYDAFYISTPSSREGLSSLWKSKHLVLQLILRDLSVRYRKTWLGWLWAVFNPAFNMLMLYCVFGVMLGFNNRNGNGPYTVTLLCGLTLWGLLIVLVNTVGDSLLNNIHLLKKVYFPRVVLTISPIGVGLVDFSISVMILKLIILASGGGESARIILAVLCVLYVIAFAWGVGCIIAILKLRFRDFRHLVPIIMQALFYLTPVVWTPGILPDDIRNILFINPLSGVFGLFRFAVLSDMCPPLPALLWSVACGLIVPTVGFYFFSHNESLVVDLE